MDASGDGRRAGFSTCREGLNRPGNTLSTGSPQAAVEKPGTAVQSQMFRIDELKNGPAHYPSRVCQKAGRGRQRTRRSEAPKPQGNGVDGGPSQGVASLGGWRREMHRPGCQQLGEVARNGRPATNNRREMRTRLAAPGGSKAVEAVPLWGRGWRRAGRRPHGLCYSSSVHPPAAGVIPDLVYGAHSSHTMR
jgi:hypothetical protein